MNLTVLGYAFIIGLLPSFIWLYFLLKEDAKHPEPHIMIALAFIVGMIAVPMALPLEQYASVIFNGKGLSLLISWALIEEVLKYAVVAIFILWRQVVDEAPDYVIYMITTALGFAAAENMLFLISPISSGHLSSTLFTVDIRFVGSTLLHVFASATIGFALAFSDKSKPSIRVLAASLGLILAVALHTTFNALIISQGTPMMFSAILLIWISAVIFFATFEVLKYFKHSNFLANNY